MRAVAAICGYTKNWTTRPCHGRRPRRLALFRREEDGAHGRIADSNSAQETTTGHFRRSGAYFIATA